MVCSTVSVQCAMVRRTISVHGVWQYNMPCSTTLSVYMAYDRTICHAPQHYQCTWRMSVQYAMFRSTISVHGVWQHSMPYSAALSVYVKTVEHAAQKINIYGCIVLPIVQHHRHISILYCGCCGTHYYQHTSVWYSLHCSTVSVCQYYNVRHTLVSSYATTILCATQHHWHMPML